MIKLIIDTTCDINSLITEDYDIDIIPLNIILDDVSYLDCVEIDIDTVYRHMKAGKVPTTSQPSYESITKAYDKCVLNNNDFIYLSFSSKLSGTYSFAKSILDEYKVKYPERKMEIIDSKGGAGGVGLIVIQVLKMIEKGLPFESIIKNIEFMINHLVYYFTISDLEWLSRGGRISKPLGYIGNVLSIKPYLTLENGVIVFSKMVRGSKKAINTLINDVRAGTTKFTKQIIGISHAEDLDTALMVEQKIKDAIVGCKTTIFQIGAVLGSHLGIGGVGVFFFNEEPEFYEFI